MTQRILDESESVQIYNLPGDINLIVNVYVSELI